MAIYFTHFGSTRIEISASSALEICVLGLLPAKVMVFGNMGTNGSELFRRDYRFLKMEYVQNGHRTNEI